MRFQTSLLAAVTLASFAYALPNNFADYHNHDGLMNDPFILPESGQVIFTPLSFEDDGFDIEKEDWDAAIFADWKMEVVNQHNAYRIHYGAPSLTWSNTLYPGTQQWANQCKFQHRCGQGNGKYGENLAAGTGSAYGFSNDSKSWMDEASKYDYNHPGFSSATGHFTQVVWKGSKQVACAIVNCRAGTIFNQASKYVVCRYSPPGNFLGPFLQNVGRHQ